MLERSRSESRLTAALLAAALVPAGAAGQEAVRVWEGELTIPTYALLPDDLNPQFRETDGSIVYPYTMQDNLGTERTDVTYRAFFLENEYLKVACLPEIGGRIQWVLDKRRNEQMFYNNQVIRPGLIALRGAWVSGGIEWNRGPQGHTVTSFSPVNVAGVENSDGSATLVIGEIEQNFRTGWDVRLTLRPGMTRLDQEIRLFNPTDLPHPYYFWNNTAFPQRDGTRFIYPMSLAMDHFGTTFTRFPEHDGVDMTRLPNYPEPTSIFAYRAVHDFFGAYDSGADRGIVQTADHRVLPGKKGWTWGQGQDGLRNQQALTDEDGPYIEVQSGPLPTQSDYEWLHPGETVAWEEQWTPVFGLGEGFEYATPHLVVERVTEGGETRFLFLASREIGPAEVRLSGAEGGSSAHQTDLNPGAVGTVTWPGGADARIEVEVRSGADVLLAYRSPLEVPQEEAPELPEAREPENAREAYQLGEQAAKDLDRATARRRYEQALGMQPEEVGATVGLAVLDLKAGLGDAARDRLGFIPASDPGWGPGQFYVAAADYGRGSFEEALAGAKKAAGVGTTTWTDSDRTPRGVEVAAWTLAGRAHLRLGQPDEAEAAFAEAVGLGGGPGAAEGLLLARLAAGQTGRAREQAEAAITQGTVSLLPWVVRLHLAADDAGRAEAAEAMLALAGEPEFAFIEVLLPVHEAGLSAVASEVVSALLDHTDFRPGPLLWLHAADWAGAAGDATLSARHLQRGVRTSLAYAFPSRSESERVLREAARAVPGEPAPRVLLGRLLAGLGRYDEAVAAWEAATDRNPALSTAHRGLAMTFWKVQDRPAEAEERFRQAIEARPRDQTLYRDLARLQLEQDRPADAAATLARLPEGIRRRHDVTIELARALNATERYQETLDMLAATQVNFREGDASVWRLFSRAAVELGRAALDAGDAEAALARFDEALTYPPNLGVGRSHRAEEARPLWFRARALQALGRTTEAAESLAACANNLPTTEEQRAFITRCAAP